MSIVLKILSCFFLLLFSTNHLVAQESKPPVDSLVTWETRYLKEGLLLTSEQEAGVYRVVKLSLQRLDSLNQLSLPEKDRKQAITKTLIEYRQSLKGLFSDIQFGKYKDLLYQQKITYRTHANLRKISVQEVVE